METVNIENITRLLKLAAENGIAVSVDKERLLIALPRNRKVHPELNQSLQLHEEALLYYLKGYGNHMPVLQTVKSEGTDILNAALKYRQETQRHIKHLELPVDYPRSGKLPFKAAAVSFSVSPEQMLPLEQLSQEEEATIETILFSVFAILLSRYSNETEVCIGMPVDPIFNAEVSSVTGAFSNLAACFVHLDPIHSFAAVLAQVKQSMLSCDTDPKPSSGELSNALLEEKDINNNTFFQFCFSFDDTTNTDPLTCSLHQAAPSFTCSDLSLHIYNTSGGLFIRFTYSSDLFSVETIDRLKLHFQILLSSVAANPQETIGRLRMLSTDEENLLLHSFNPGTIGYPADKTIIHLFEEQVARTPGHIAVVFEDHQFTYKEINESANRLAHYLRRNGVGPEVLTGICLNRSVVMITGILAILKAGGAYVPMDPDYPAERIHYMMEDASIRVMLTDTATAALFNGIPLEKLLVLDGDTSFLEDESLENPVVLNKPEHLAYVIYTSGTTGRPKGALLEHRNIVRLFITDQPLFHFTPDDVWTMFHSFCFDFSVWEMYGALLFGGKLLVFSKTISRDMAAFSRLIEKEKVTILNQTPTAFAMLQEQVKAHEFSMDSLRYVIFGGEALKPATLKYWYERYPNCRLINMYGITETTVHVTYKEIGTREILKGAGNIGVPIPTLSCYILDANMNLSPFNVPGELYVGGAGLARGYLNRPELTNAKFIANPFSNKAGARLYRSGDLARRCSDGSIEYFGRIDHQVKIRGFRIELGEIESIIHQSGFVQQGVVLAKEDDKENLRLVAYVVSNDEFDKEAMKKYLAAHLPEYMIPQLWVPLPAIPVTSNGKADKALLKSYPLTWSDEPGNSIEYTDETERKLATIWQRLLLTDNVGRQDRFFSLGGDSFLLTRLNTEIRQVFNISLSPAFLFSDPGFEELAACIKTSRNDNQYLPGSFNGSNEVTPAQKYLYFFKKLNPANPFPNSCITYRLNGNTDLQRLEKALQQVVHHNEALRTSYQYQKGRVYPSVEDHVSIRIQFVVAVENDIDDTIAKLTIPFNFSEPPLIRAFIIKTSTDKVFLHIDMPHINSDGMSCAVIIRELYEAYCGNSIPENKLQFEYYADYFQQYRQSDQYQTDAQFWLAQQLHETSDTIYHNSFLKSTPDQLANAGQSVIAAMPPELKETMQIMIKEATLTTFQFLLAGYILFLYKANSCKALNITIPVHNRNRPGFENIVGLMVNTIVLKFSINENLSLLQFAVYVKKVVMEAMQHSEYPGESLQEAYKKQHQCRQLSQTFFNYQQFTGKYIVPEGEWDLYIHPKRLENLPLSVDVYDNHQAIFLLLSSRNDCFGPESLNNFANTFFELLKMLIAYQDMRLEDLKDIELPVLV
jgi:amino acid adenylation domain-containing protein